MVIGFNLYYLPLLSGIEMYSEAFLTDLFVFGSLQGAWACWTMTRWSSVTCTDRCFMVRRTRARPRLCLLPVQLKGTDWHLHTLDECVRVHHQRLWPTVEVKSTLIPVSSTEQKCIRSFEKRASADTDLKQRSQCFDIISKCSVTMITGVFLCFLWHFGCFIMHAGAFQSHHRLYLVVYFSSVCKYCVNMLF